MEDATTEPGPEGQLEERLRKLEEEAARLREQLSSDTKNAVPEAVAAPTPGAELEAVSASAEPPEDDLVPATATQVAEADKLIARARLERSRGNGSIATKLLEEAEKVAPTAPAVLELIGDDHAERKAYSKARDAYAKAMRVDPENITIERKHADMVFRTSAAGAAFTTSTFEAQASARNAIVFSAIVPGLGQLVKGQFGKGIGFMIFWVGSLIAIMTIPNGLKGLIQSLTGKGTDFNALILVALFIAFVTWISSFIDANAGSKMPGAGRAAKGPRPEPPVNLPFE